MEQESAHARSVGAAGLCGPCRRQDVFQVLIMLRPQQQGGQSPEEPLEISRGTGGRPSHEKSWVLNINPSTSNCPFCLFAVAALQLPRTENTQYHILACTEIFGYARKPLPAGDKIWMRVGRRVVQRHRRGDEWTVQRLSLSETGGRMAKVQVLGAPYAVQLPPGRLLLGEELRARFELHRARGWINRCNENHRECDLKHTVTLPDNFRVIDVKEYCVTALKPGHAYVALSYVWGGVQQLQLTSGNSVSLTSPGNLRIYISNISTTVRDTIHLYQHLGERYL